MKKGFIYFFLYFLILCFVFRSIIINSSTHLYNWGDGPFSIWVIYENIEKFTTLNFIHFFDTRAFYPHQYTLLLSDTFIPQSIIESFNKGYIISVIQFGSSIRRNNCHDIDLAVVVKRGNYKKFLDKMYGRNFHDFDISLIKEEEIQGPGKFKFGGHGCHFLYSLIKGKTLYGANPFDKFKVNNSQIKKSALDRMYDYIEDVRRAVFVGKVKKSIKKRWPKFIRLSLYLLDSSLKYPDVLDLNNKEVKYYLEKNKINCMPDNLLNAYEDIWDRVLRKYKLI